MDGREGDLRPFAASVFTAGREGRQKQIKLFTLILLYDKYTCESAGSFGVRASEYALACLSRTGRHVVALAVAGHGLA